MFKKILIANRGDYMPEGRAAAQPHGLAHAVRTGDFTAGEDRV